MNRRTIRVLWISVSALVIVSMLALAGCAGETKEIKNPNTFIQATIGDVDSLDPAYAYDTASMEQIQAIYEPLIYYDGESTSDFTGILATEWNISEDGQTYRFKIRKDVKFHDGGDLTPEDVEYSFERGMVQDSSYGPQPMILEPLLGVFTTRNEDGSLIPLEDIKAAVEVEGDWVQFNLVAPFAPFLDILAGTWASIVDKEWCITEGDWNGTQQSYEELNNPDANDTPLNSKTNGTGPFKLEKWNPGIDITLVRNDGYWREKAKFERVITKNVPEWTTRKLELLAGDVDYAYVPRANIGELEVAGQPSEGLKNYKGLAQLSADAFFFQYDIAEGSTRIGSGVLDGNGIPRDFFTDKDLRIGFNYAFDWQTYIEEAYLGEYQQMASPAIEGLPFRNPDQAMYSFDLAKAEEHLRKAWDGQVWEKGFRFTLCYEAGQLERKTAAEILQSGLETVNPKFQIDLQPLEFSDFLNEAVYSGLLPMFQLPWQAAYPDPHDFFHAFMHSEGAYAGALGYNKPTVDALIHQGVSATDPAERQSVYYQLQQIYHEDPPGIMLGQPLGRRYFRDWVQGYVFNPMDPGDISHVYYLSKEY